MGVRKISKETLSEQREREKVREGVYDWESQLETSALGNHFFGKAESQNLVRDISEETEW